MRCRARERQRGLERRCLGLPSRPEVVREQDKRLLARAWRVGTRRIF